MIFLSSSFPIRFLFYFLFLSFTTVSISYAGNDTDHEALLKFKSTITQDPYGVLTSWDNPRHLCDWTGVTCGKRHRRVTRLILDFKGLQGPLSPYIGNLSFLRVLSLTNNNFQGVIPHELDRLHRLRALYLYGNKFNGVIPTNISTCRNLKAIGLSDNELVGSIPRDISFLSKLTFMSLDINKLTGGIPHFLGNITSLEVISIKENPFGGSIPDTLGRLKNLRIFYCGGCNLYGIIPHSMYNLSLLTNISLSENHLNGSLSLANGTMLPRLVFLQLGRNQLKGTLPPSISNCSRMRELDMSGNNFSGKLTINFGNLRDISFIALQNNNYASDEADEMKFIDSLRNCTNLEALDISYCKFQGVLPGSIGNLSNSLRYLSLEGNMLHGNLPRSVGNLIGLEALSLVGNQFTGNIPSTIGNLHKLKLLGLYDNKLSGRIPDAIGNLSLLITLDLALNKLEGVIPSSLGNCHRLLKLYLSDNKLSGNIPIQVLQLSSLSIILDLSQNNLFGSLPAEVGGLTMLSALDLSHNNLSGNIPNSLGGCVSLSWLSLAENFFQGMIPPSLVSLKGLVELDISHNNLSSRIPKFLELFNSLTYLNVSYNDFEGEVPMLGVFTNESAFSFVGNGMLCGGSVKLGLPRCKKTKKHTNKVPLYVVVILIASTVLLIIICLLCAWYTKKSKTRASESLAIDRFLKVSYNQLLMATNGFSESNLIGNGGFSSVYKGLLDEDNSYVAVKVLHLQNQGAQKSFMRECEAWRSIRHRNLLRIITSCSSIDFQGNDFKALVYEYMSKGSLHDWLHTSEGTSGLNLLTITNILIDIASALDYIHNQCVPSLVHGDLKPENILLDDDMVAHVGDFGLARFIGSTSYQNSSSAMRGTVGYVAPEYGLGGEMTSSGDIYSFGILVLEVMSGKRPTDEIFNDGLSLHIFAYMALPDHVTDAIDSNILSIYQGMSSLNNEASAKKLEECMALTLKIGLACSVDSPSQRMDIKTVLHELHHIQYTLQTVMV